MRPLCVRIARLLWNLVASGWQPRQDTTSFIEWDPRAYNSLADHAANTALDQHRDWMQSEQLSTSPMLAECTNFRLCVDGARRGDGSAAAGLTLLAYPGGSDPIILRRGGFLLGNLSSAFLSEMLAME